MDPQGDDKKEAGERQRETETETGTGTERQRHRERQRDGGEREGWRERQRGKEGETDERVFRIIKRGRGGGVISYPSGCINYEPSI